MTFDIRPVRPEDVEPLQALTVEAFEPVFASFARLLGSELFARVYPDWKTLQSNLVATLCSGDETQVLVAEVTGRPAGMVAVRLNPETAEGEIGFLVVQPAHQNGGIGAALIQHALSQMRAAGMRLAVVSTGGDESHAPARHAYEKAGFVAIPNVFYAMTLD